MMSLKHHHSISDEFKLRVVEKAEAIRKRKVGCYFDVVKKAVRNWFKQKQSLKNLGRKQSNHCGKLKWPALKGNLYSWVFEQRKLGHSALTVKIYLQAK